VAGTRWAGGPAVTPDTPFNVASVSKVVTAAGVFGLVEDGRLALTDTVQARLPGTRLVDAEGRDRAAEVTVAQLLAHQGGLPHQPGALDPTQVGSSWGDPELLTKLTGAWRLPLGRAPGQWGYANTGVAEAAAHGRAQEGGAVVFHPPGWYGSRYALPFTGLFTSTPDLARFGQALLAASRDPQDALHPMTTHGPTPGQGPGPVYRVRRGLHTVEHDGGGPGFMAWLVVIPERDVVLALACNGDGEDKARARRLFELTEAMLAVVLPP
jgi:CubicO group peptidase (beta-lactamase class C family)